MGLVGTFDSLEYFPQALPMCGELNNVWLMQVKIHIKILSRKDHRILILFTLFAPMTTVEDVSKILSIEIR